MAYDPSLMNGRALSAFETLQDSWDGPLNVNSGHRTREHNDKVGGAKHSQHIHGKAFDIDTSMYSKEQRIELLKAARAAGFSGNGVYDTSFHFDVGPDRAWGADYSRGSVPEWARETLGMPAGEIDEDAYRAPGDLPKHAQTELPRESSAIDKLMLAQELVGGDGGDAEFLHDPTSMMNLGGDTARGGLAIAPGKAQDTLEERVNPYELYESMTLPQGEAPQVSQRPQARPSPLADEMAVDMHDIPERAVNIHDGPPPNPKYVPPSPIDEAVDNAARRQEHNADKEKNKNRKPGLDRLGFLGKAAGILGPPPRSGGLSSSVKRGKKRDPLKRMGIASLV